ncbi:MAG: twin-arginine translocation signal domain-containing protein, partial [Candidatus Omnitrophica bacterium]|nr:twin-arginine translocation signal domain-containing protein [Candidatus Omnitrophota bacterium]
MILKQVVLQSKKINNPFTLMHWNGGGAQMKNQTQTTRRDFIKSTAASTAAVSLPWIIPS